jgi:hypothetical protein
MLRSGRVIVGVELPAVEMHFSGADDLAAF